MANYHLYYLRDTELIGDDRIQADDDDDAARIAKERGKGLAVEVWNARGRVRIVAPAQGVSASRQANPRAD